jgi:23S rRNA (cytidine1920-2'-O)/16S rRNA (cytidine1409-2'-O)-methyltransferase
VTRLDAYLVERGLVRSRERAKEAVRAGLVTVDGETVRKPSLYLAEGAVVRCEGETHPYVSRGGLKLAGALRTFGVDPTELTCLDLGASTGGFTQVLLEEGAKKVFAVDVGHGQLAVEIAADERVVNLEGTHAADLSRSLIPEPIDLLVCDVSFISIKKALPPAMALCRPGSHLVTLVKPQFEVGRSRVGKGGVVRIPSGHLAYWVGNEIVPWVEEQGWVSLGYMFSPIRGGDGNVEFLLGARRG